MIFDFCSIALIICTVVSIGLITIGLLYHFPDVFVSGVILTVLFVLVGWVMVGNLSDYGKGYIPVKVSIVITPTTVVALDDYNQPVATFTDVKSYKLLSEKTNAIIYRNCWTNMYRNVMMTGTYSSNTN